MGAQYNPPGGGATIPDTTNLIKGDGAGNGADTGVDPTPLTVLNGANGLVQLGGDGALPGLSGAALLGVRTTGSISNNRVLVADGGGNVADGGKTIDMLPTIAGPVVQGNLVYGADGSTTISDAGYAFNVAAILEESSITPCADGTVTPVTSITTVNGIITAIS